MDESFIRENSFLYIHLNDANLHRIIQFPKYKETFVYMFKNLF